MVRRRHGLFLRVFAVADKSRTQHDEHHADPAHRGNVFAQKPHRGEGGKDKAQAGQRPQEADVALGHQHQQADKKQRLKKDAEPDGLAGQAGFDDAENFGRGVALHVADLHDAFLEQHDSGGFAEEAGEQN